MHLHHIMKLSINEHKNSKFTVKPKQTNIFFSHLKLTNRCHIELSASSGYQHKQSPSITTTKLVLIITTNCFQQYMYTYQKPGVQLECCSIVSLYDLTTIMNTIVGTVFTRNCCAILCYIPASLEIFLQDLLR